MESNGDEEALPQELIVEILLRLPVKSLLKFRSISKSWLSLISSPVFVKAHLLLSATNKEYTHHRVMFKASDPDRRVMFSVENLNHTINDCSLSSLLYDSITEAFDLDHPGNNKLPRIVGSFNGLICLAVGISDLFLWNPSIKKYYKLPNHGSTVSRISLQFGFSYDEFQNDYKVVGIFPIYGNGSLYRVEVKIYSLKSNYWRRIDDFQGKELFDEPGKLVNKKFHWLDWMHDIISIDLDDEKWSMVEKPCFFKECSSLVLGVLGSDLSASCNYGWDRADVWIMKEYGVKESWTKMFTITSFTSFRCIFSAPIFVSNEGIILLQRGSRLTKYNPKDKMIKYIDVINFARCLDQEIYVKSLIWPF